MRKKHPTSRVCMVLVWFVHLISDQIKARTGLKRAGLKRYYCTTVCLNTCTTPHTRSCVTSRTLATPGSVSLEHVCWVWSVLLLGIQVCYNVCSGTILVAATLHELRYQSRLRSEVLLASFSLHSSMGGCQTVSASNGAVREHVPVCMIFVLGSSHTIPYWC